jgi:hypothetical protein
MPDQAPAPETRPPDEEEDDYLTMSFLPTASTQKPKESSLARTARLKREAAERGRIPPKAEREALAKEAQAKALATALPTTASKGAAMMAKMGFKPGSALGAKGNEGRVEPLVVSVKDGREGIGLESERKRKVREELEAAGETVKRTKISEEDFRERESREREEKRLEGMWWGGMKVLEGFEEDVSPPAEGADGEPATAKKITKKVNLLYRPLVRSRQIAEQEGRARHDLSQSLSRNPDYTTEDADDSLALGTTVEDIEEEGEDEELATYEALSASEKLEKVVSHLRTEWRYCFWCKFKYATAEEMDESCPGEGEDAHG